QSAEIEQWTGFWAGKWTLISADRCWQDAAGLLGIYYRHAAERTWISSSPAILGGYLPYVEPAPRRAADRPRQGHGTDPRTPDHPGRRLKAARATHDRGAHRCDPAGPVHATHERRREFPAACRNAPDGRRQLGRAGIPRAPGRVDRWVR